MNVHCDALQEAAAIAQLEENPTAVVEEAVAGTSDDMVSAAENVDGISRNVEGLVTAAESLESFINTTFDTVSAENWNSKTARQYQLGVASILAAGGVRMPVEMYAASFEAAGTEQTNEENREESKNKGKDLAKRMWAGFLKALESLINGLMLFVGKIRENSAAIRKAGENLWARAKKAKGSPSKDTFDGSPAWGRYLYKGGSQGKPVAAVGAMTYELLHVAIPTIHTYADMATAYFDAAAKTKNPDGEAWVKKVKDSIEDLGEVFNNSKFEVEVELHGLVPKTKVKITKNEAKVSDVKVMTLQEVNGVADAIVKVADTMGKVETAMKEAVKGVQGLKSKFAAPTSFLTGQQSEVKPSDLSSIIGDITALAKAVLPHTAEVVRGAYTHATSSLKLYKGDEEKIGSEQSSSEKETKKEPPKEEKKDDKKDE